MSEEEPGEEYNCACVEIWEQAGEVKGSMTVCSEGCEDDLFKS